MRIAYSSGGGATSRQRRISDGARPDRNATSNGPRCVERWHGGLRASRRSADLCRVPSKDRVCEVDAPRHPAGYGRADRDRLAGTIPAAGTLAAPVAALILAVGPD